MPAAQSQHDLINECLLICGQRTVDVEDDGSPEWNIAAAAYNHGLTRLVDSANWKFGKFVEEVASRAGDADDPAWNDAYAKPAGCLHVTRVMDEGGGELDDWKIVGAQIYVNKDDGITVEFIGDVDPTQYPGLFATALKHYVMAGIYRGLLKDPKTAHAEQATGEEMLREARPRVDSQEPGRAKFVSGLAAARRTRRG